MCLLFRTGKGYFAMSKRQMSRTVQTGLPGGEYTNIIDGSRVMVGGDGSATIEINNPGDKIQSQLYGLSVFMKKGSFIKNPFCVFAHSGIMYCTISCIYICKLEGIFAICVGCDGTGPGPTPGPTTSTTDGGGEDTTTQSPPQPGEKKRTVIFVEKQTNSGQDVFIRGGVSPDKSIPITVNRFTDQS